MILVDIPLSFVVRIKGFSNVSNKNDRIYVGFESKL